jgi:hypothetical protein
MLKQLLVPQGSACLRYRESMPPARDENKSCVDDLHLRDPQSYSPLIVM